MSKFFISSKCVLFYSLLAMVLFVSTTTAQEQPARTGAKPAGEVEQEHTNSQEKGEKGKQAWTVGMSKETPSTFTIKAKEARLGEITNDLSRKIKVPFFVSPLLAKQNITLEFSGMTLEGTLRMLAPQAYIDYEVGGGDQSQPKVLAVYLNAFNEKPPSLTEVVKGNSEAILIDGDTEEGVGDEEEKKKRDEANPLKVSYTKNALTIRARKQPLTVVLFKVASELGIPFEMRYESPEVVDIDYNDYSVVQALRSLSSSVRLFYRTDLQTYDVQPLRILLAAPTAVKY